jgi:uncharacterized protein (DUF983 family)
MAENEKHQGRKEEWLNLPRRKCDNCGASYKPKRPVKPKEHGFCKDPCRFQFHRNGGSFVKLKALIEPAVRKSMRLEEICPECNGKGTLNKGARVGVVVCETCINGRVLTPLGADILALVTSGHAARIVQNVQDLLRQGAK